MDEAGEGDPVLLFDQVVQGRNDLTDEDGIVRDDAPGIGHGLEHAVVPDLAVGPVAGRSVDLLHHGLRDPGDLHDPVEGDAGGERVLDHPEAGEDVPDRCGREDVDVADELGRDPLAPERLEELDPVVPGPADDRDVPGPVIPLRLLLLRHEPGGEEPADLPGNEVHLGLLVPAPGDRHRISGRVNRHELLLCPVRGLLHQLEGEGEDRPRVPVVVIEEDLVRPGEVLPEVLEVREVCAPEPVDGLVVVAHHADIVPGKLLDELELGIVRVLELVHEDVAVAVPVPVEDERFSLEETDCLGDHVVEVEEHLFPLVLLVLPVDPEEVRELANRVLFLRPKLLRPLLPDVCIEVIRREQLVPERADTAEHRCDHLGCVVPDLHVLEPEVIDVPEPPDELVRLRDDPGREADPGFKHVLFEHVHAERVERADRKVPRLGLFLESVEHLLRCFLGEGEGEDLVGPDSTGDEVEDLLGDHPGLAGTGTGEDELVAVRCNGTLLGGIEGH